MVATDGEFAQWLSQAADCRTAVHRRQRGLLQCTFAFRQRCGSDYYSSRLLTHFLLHCRAASRSRPSRACSALAVLPPPNSKACLPSRPCSKPTTAWMAVPTANSCRAMPEPSSNFASVTPTPAARTLSISLMPPSAYVSHASLCTTSSRSLASIVFRPRLSPRHRAERQWRSSRVEQQPRAGDAGAPSGATAATPFSSAARSSRAPS